MPPPAATQEDQGKDGLRISKKIYIYIYIYRVSQEEWTKLRESVPYVKIYRYNPNTYVQS